MVFIIDDDKYVLRGFQILLRSVGLESRVFEEVEEFLEKWEPALSDLIIMDIHMPGMNGIDLLAYLDEIKLFLPVIVVTAYDEDESRSISEKYGVLAYLTKPVDSDRLIDIIRNHTDETHKYSEC